MKKNLFVIRKMMVGLMFAAVVIAAPASAKSTKKAVTPAINIQPSVEFIGADNTGTLLHVNFDADSTVKFELTVNDANGELIYSQSFEAAKFSKYIKLVKEDSEASGALQVSIRTLPNGTKHSFSVVNEDKIINEVSVTKI